MVMRPRRWSLIETERDWASPYCLARSPAWPERDRIGLGKPTRTGEHSGAMAIRRERASAPRNPGRSAVAAALRRVRTALEQGGLLLLQDAELPAATTLIVGEVVRGSWWGHPQNKLVYETLQRLGSEVLWTKLVRGKETIVARSLWPALLGVARSREAWQLRGLASAGRQLLELVDAAPASLRLDQVTLRAAEAPPRELARELERRLLVHGDELHTESGRHVELLESWAQWQRDRGVTELPGAAEARATLETAVRNWPKPGLPWQK